MKMKSPATSSLYYSILVIGFIHSLVSFPPASGASVISGVETIPSSKATLETMTGPGRWYAVDFEEDGLVCGDGKTPFSILFKRSAASGPYSSASPSASASTKWLIEFEGGRTPACWVESDSSNSNSNKCGCAVAPDRLRPSWSDRPAPSSSSSSGSSWSQDANIDFTVEVTTATSAPLGTTGSSPRPSSSSSSSSSGSSGEGQGDTDDGMFMVLDDIPVCHGWSQGLIQDDLQALFELQTNDQTASATVTYDLPIPLRPADSTMNGDWWQGSIQDDFNYVLVPDCTADSHLGFNMDAIEYDNSSCDGDSSNAAGTTTSTIYHRGGMNRHAVVEWIATAAASASGGGIDALVTVAGGRPLDGNGQCGGSSSQQPSVSSIAPVLATSQAVTTWGLDVETLTIQDGVGLQRRPTQSEMQESWKIEDDELFATKAMESYNVTDRQDTPYDIQDVAVHLITDLVSSKTSNGSPNTVVWIAPSNKDDRTTLFDQLNSQNMPIHTYEVQPLNMEEQERSCPRFAFPHPSDSFSEFLTTQVAWNPEMKMMSQSAIMSYTASSSANPEDGDGDGRSRLSFLSVVLIMVGFVAIVYIAYYAMRRRRLNQNQSPPPSPVDLWFWCLTRYPGTFLVISLLIPIILAVTVIVQQDGQISVNLDFDSYLEINTPLENTRRIYEWKQRQQWQSRDFEEDQCAYINTADGPNRLLSHHESQDDNIQVTFERLDITKAIDWDFILQQAENNATDADENQRKLDMANLLYYSGGEVISIMYTNPKGGNVFEPAALEEIYQFEQSIYNFPGFANYCFGFGGSRCLPIDSLVTHFFTSSGSLKTMETETITRSFLGNQPALWKLDQYFGPKNLGSNVTRSFIFFRNVGGDQSAAQPFLKRFYTDFLWKNQGKYQNMVFTWDNHYLKELEAQDALRHDSLWSIGSLCFIALMIAFKVRNLFVTGTAMLSLILSFFAAYYYVSAHFAIENATLLWVAGLFVMLGIGADDIFLMVDSFEHAKSTGEDESQTSNPSNCSVGSDADINICEDSKLEDSQRESIRRVMVKAYRQAGGMMAVSSVTTAVCFFSNAFGILVVIQEFGIFMGMVVLINYIHVMTILPSALLVDSFYVLPMRQRFREWCASKLGINNKKTFKTESSTEEQELHANVDTLAVPNTSASADESVDEIPDLSMMNQLDRFLVAKFSPFVSKRRLFTLASCLILAMVLGVLGYFKFYVAGDITLFSEKYNLGRLTIINDLYFNGDIYKTIEENKPDQDPTAAPVPPPQSSSSSSSSSNNAAPLPDSITGGISSSSGSGTASGGGIGAPQAPVGNGQQAPPSNTATGVEGDDSNVFEGSLGLAPPSQSSPNGSTGYSNVSGDGNEQEGTSANTQSSTSSSSTTPINVVSPPLLGGSDKDLRRVEAIWIKLIFGVDPPDDSGSYQLWKLSDDKARSIGIHGDLQNSGSSIDVSRPEVQSLLFNTVSKARSDTSLHLLAKTTWIEILHDYALSDPLLEDFPIPQPQFESYIQRLAAVDEDFAEQINENLGTTSPGTAGRYTFAGLSIQVDAVASLNGSPSTELSEIVYRRFTEFSNAVNAESVALGEDVPTLVVQSSIFLDAYRVDATIQSTVLTWVVANGLCLLVILMFTHNVALSCMVMATIILILLCLNGLLFGIAKIPFGPVEALGVSIFVGLSANYSLHVVHAYQHSKAQTQSSKAHYALYAVGSPIVASALSTMGASVFLFGCRTWVFIELGILLLCITSMALLYSMTFLVAWLSLAGPRPYENAHGKTVHRWDIKELLYGCFCRRRTDDAEDVAVDEKGQCLELASAVQKESSPPGETSRRSRKASQRTSSAESLMSTQASIDGSLYSVYSASDSNSIQRPMQPTTFEECENGCHDDDAKDEEEDDYSIEVTSDDEN